ncbi:exportin-6-B-like [Tropilaelaps mercedesae]|uniref:Exportin-6-B-like n=1 Tax=Tropilaelaps mercedesae TaxID=418985 RepID=A0A1V9XTQ0_9ACAR|nr:exportin-6-B-like [Tropilaelaps mercedesae]
MTDPASILSALEALLEEFFSPSCTNERKRVIEEQLSNFSRQSDACQLCVAFLHQTQNGYVLMFCVNLVEGVVQRSWLRMMSDEKAQVRKNVSELLVRSVTGASPSSVGGAIGGSQLPDGTFPTLPVFVRNKLCKLMVNIGRFDWPHFYPDFFNYIFQMIHNPPTRLVGIIMLRTSSEEFAAPKDDLCASRKKELRHLLNNIVPQMLTTVTGVLDGVLVSCQRSSSTPPPSPLHHSQQQPAQQQSSVAGTRGPAGGFLISTKRPLNPHRPLDTESREIALACLATLEHLTSWVAIGSNFGPSMLHTLFAFIALGCGDRSDLNAEVAVAAIGVVNELIYKKCFTQKDTQACLAVVFQNTLETLQLVTSPSPSGGGVDCSRSSRLRDLDECLIGKLAELVHILLDSHLARFPDEQPCEGAVHHFLQLAQVFTFGIRSPVQYRGSLETWLSFLEQVESSRKAAKFKQLLATVLHETLDKLMTERHPAYLEMPWGSPTSGKTDSEWETYLSKSLQVVAKMSDVDLEETCGQLLPAWQRVVGSFEAGNCSPGSLRDLASLSRAVGCLSAALNTSAYKETNHVAQVSAKLVDDLMRVIRRAEAILAHHQQQTVRADHRALVDTLIQVECECLASIQSFLYLLSGALLQHHGTPHSSVVGARERTATDIAELALEVLLNYRARGGVASGAEAAGVLVSLTAAFRLPRFVDDLLPNLVSAVSSSLLLATHVTSSDTYGSLELQVPAKCSVAVQNVCLLPWSDTNLIASSVDQRWELRGGHYEALLTILLPCTQQHSLNSSSNSGQSILTATNNNLSSSNLNNNNNHVEQQGQLMHQFLNEGDLASQAATIARKFRVAATLLEAIGSAGGIVRTKALQAQGWNLLLETATVLTANGRPEFMIAEAVIPFYKACAQVMPLQKLDHSLDRLLESIAALPALAFDSIDPKLEPYLEAVLDFLKVVLGSPAKGNIFLGRILGLALRLWSKASASQSSNLRPALIQLLHEVVSQHWRYFFPANVASLLSASGSPALDADVEHRGELVAIMNAYGCCLLQQGDLETFGLVLRSLGELQTKWNLFQRPIFRVAAGENECGLLGQFIGVLLRCLLQRSHDLLREEMLHLVFAMANTMPLDAFHQIYLPQFLMQIESLDNYQREQLVRGFHIQSDLPSFTENLNSFLTDIRYYVVCTQTLPASSVVI